MAMRPFHRALPDSPAPHTNPRGFNATGTCATASPPATQHTATTPAAFATAHTPHSNCSGSCVGSPTAPLHHTHRAPGPQKRKPNHHKSHFTATQANFTPATRTHNCAIHHHFLAGSTWHTGTMAASASTIRNAAHTSTSTTHQHNQHLTNDRATARPNQPQPPQSHSTQHTQSTPHAPRAHTHPRPHTHTHPALSAATSRAVGCY